MAAYAAEAAKKIAAERAAKEAAALEDEVPEENHNIIEQDEAVKIVHKSIAHLSRDKKPHAALFNAAHLHHKSETN